MKKEQIDQANNILDQISDIESSLFNLDMAERKSKTTYVAILPEAAGIYQHMRLTDYETAEVLKFMRALLETRHDTLTKTLDAL